MASDIIVVCVVNR